MAKTKPDWLKKYTKLEYLHDILTSNSLFLGTPESWPDKNDQFCINKYAKKKSLQGVRASCLNMGADRYHFWEVYGGKEKGVCLWFCARTLKEHVKRVDGLRGQDVRYLHTNNSRDISIAELPFIKRDQYKDEREFRVIRDISADCQSGDEYFEFPPASLKRIYLNPWLEPCCVRRWKEDIQMWKCGGLEHLCVKQNQSLDRKEWQQMVRRKLIRE